MDLKHTFSENPVSVNIPRTRFDMNHRVKTTFNAGALIPLDWMTISPGDTIEDDLGSLVRMLTPPKVPTMDTAVLSVYAFFVPSRLCWSHWEELHGANKTDAWTQLSEFVLPGFVVAQDITNSSYGADSQAVAPGSALDYLGLPVAKLNAASKHTISGLSILPVMSYGLIWNEWFRDENLQDPLAWLTTLYNASSGSSYNPSSFGTPDGSYLSRVCLPANKFHDVYTSCLPAPQKGAAVVLPLGNEAPVVGSRTLPHSVGETPLFEDSSGHALNGGAEFVSGALQAYSSSVSAATDIGKWNLVADLSEATAATVNDLRYAFALQRILEADARGGTRYTEQLYSFFGVRNGDARLQRPEFLGGSNTNLGIQQVENNSNTSTGTLGAYSLTFGKNSHFIKSFTEHGILMYVACVRHKPSYGQGVSADWRKSRRYDFYNPKLAHIGEQPIPKVELYAYGNNVDVRSTSLSTFGFNEAWYEYRYLPDRVSGLVRPGLATDLQGYTYVDDYDSVPTLSADWIVEDPVNIAKTQGLENLVDNFGNPLQFVGDFYFERKATREMPLYNVPGLIDHY